MWYDARTHFLRQIARVAIDIFLKKYNHVRTWELLLDIVSNNYRYYLNQLIPEIRLTKAKYG